MELTQRERDYLAAAIYGEARGESVEGQQAVAWTILNRAVATGQTIEQVVLDATANGVAQYTAFSPRDSNRGQIQEAAQQGDATWRSAQAVAVSVLAGEVPDPTGGATHYYNPSKVNPRWGRRHSGWQEHLEVGGHVFGRAAGGVPNPPNSTALAPLNFGQQPEFQLPQSSGPNPARNFNAQELAAIAPPTPSAPTALRSARAPMLPATPTQMRAAKSPPATSAQPLEGVPLEDRTIPGAQRRSEIVLNPRSQPISSLTPEAQRMVGYVQERSGLPTVTVNHGYRSDADHARLEAQGDDPAPRSQHRTGNAVDFSLAGLTQDEAVRMLDAAIYGGAREIGANNPRPDGGLLHVGIPRNPDHLGNGRRSWGYPRDGRPPADWVNESQYYRDLQRGRQYFRQGNPVARPDNLGQPQSIFPARPSTPSALPAAPQRAETTPRLSERYAGSDSGSPVLPSSFPARPSMGTGGLPAARNDINSMRAQSEAIQRQTTRPSVPTARISRPATPVPTQQRSPTDFQYAARPPTPPPAPRTPSPITAPQLGSQRGFFSSMEGADYTKPEAVAAPRFNAPNPVPRPTVPPNPVARPSTLPQFGMVPNPVARPNVPQFAGVPAPVPRTRARQVPNPIAAPRRQSPPLLDLAGFNDWVGGIGQSIGNALSPMVTMTPAMANAPTRYAGDVVLPPAPQRAPTIGAPMNIAPPQQRAGVPNDDNSFVRSLFSRQPTNPSLNGRAQGPWNSTGGEGGFVW